MAPRPPISSHRATVEPRSSEPVVGRFEPPGGPWPEEVGSVVTDADT